MFLGEGRRAFLEFLRNLTPQILFLTLALIYGSKLDQTRFELSGAGVWTATPFVLCLLVFFGSTIANMGLFVDGAISSTPALDEQVAEIKAKKIPAWMRTWHLICAAWRHNKPAFFQLLLVMAICEIALVAVFIVAIQGAAASPFIKR